MPKNSSAARREAARLLATAEGISYTAALRRIREAPSQPSPSAAPMPGPAGLQNAAAALPGGPGSEFPGLDAGRDLAGRSGFRDGGVGGLRARSRLLALALHAAHERHPVEVQGCQACWHTHLAHYDGGAAARQGCVACEDAARACPVFVPSGRPKLSKHTGPVSADPVPCPWLCGDGLDQHGEGSGCYRCGCRYGDAAAEPPAGVAYHGYPAGGPEGRLVVIEAPPGTPVSVLRHVDRHSPAEFAWGYPGSGPAELALSLLIAALGPAAACPACRGAGKMTWDQDGHQAPCGPAREDEVDPETIVACALCDDGYRTLPHQEFKSEVVSGWSPDAQWVIDRAQIIGWLRDASCWLIPPAGTEKAPGV
jgi:hypothetical protein